MKEYESEPLEDVIEDLSEMRGQSYLLAEEGFRRAVAISPYITEEFAENHYFDNTDPGEDDYPWAVSRAFSELQRPAKEARGMARAWPHRQIATVADISELMVEAIGEEPSTSSALGGGSTLDMQYEDNIETLREAFDLG